MATKKRAVTKTPAKQSSARKRAAAKRPTTPKKATSKKTAGKKATRKAGARQEDNYTNPALRERLKRKIIAGDKGGRPGQWSARKAQLLAHEYEQAGGSYRSARRTGKQESLEHWGEEKWRTSDGSKAVRKGTTKRYLPDAAWKKLSPAERASTEKKKAEGSRSGQQFVGNTAAAKKARRAATSKRPATKKK